MTDAKGILRTLGGVESCMVGVLAMFLSCQSQVRSPSAQVNYSRSDISVQIWGHRFDASLPHQRLFNARIGDEPYDGDENIQCEGQPGGDKRKRNGHQIDEQRNFAFDIRA